MDRVRRSATCAETRAIVDLEDELFARRYQWSGTTLGNSAMENSPDEMARLVPGACVTDSKGLHDKMLHTVITPKGKERRVDIECLALKEGLETCSTKFFGVHSGAQLGRSLTKDTGTEPFASSLRNGQRWRVIFDTLLCLRRNVELLRSVPEKNQVKRALNVEGLNRDGTTHVCVYCTRTSTEHPEHIRHSSHVVSLMHFFLQEWAGSFSGLV